MFSTKLGWYSDGHEGVPEQAEEEQHNIAEAAPNELKLGEDR